MRRDRDRLPAGRAVRDLAAARDRHPLLAPAQQIVGVRVGAVFPALHRSPRAGAHGDERHAERGAETLLRAGHVQIDAPLVGAHVQTRDRRHGIEQEQRVDRARDLADGGRRIRGAGRRLVVNEGDRLRAQPLGLVREAIEIEARAPFDGELRHVGADTVHDLAHQHSEGAGADDEHAVARLDDGQRARLERRAAGARHDEHLALRLEDVPQRKRGRLEHSLVERAIVLNGRRLVHRLDDGEGQLGRPRNHEGGTRMDLEPADRRRHRDLLRSRLRQVYLSARRPAAPRDE